MITLKFKTEEVFENFCMGADPMLVTIIRFINTSGSVPTITSAYRPGDPGVHGTLPFRGLDLRHNTRAYQIVKDVNSRFKYDPTRPNKRCAMVHDVGQGTHIHLQSHPNTFDMWRAV